MTEFLTSQLGVSIVLAIVLLVVILTVVAYCIYFERKISAWMQDRKGPNRVGPWGLLQPLADGAKFLFKEDLIPGHVDKALFLLAPALTFVMAMIGFAAIPWGGQWTVAGHVVEVQVANPDIGLLYILGVGSMGVYGIVLGGWASNNKYSLYGAIRATAQMLSYEIPLGLCVLVVVLTVGTLRLEDITLVQTSMDYWYGLLPAWNVFFHPVTFVILFIAVLAECNRTPFDVAEAEQELVGGYHTEYGALKFGMFFLGEYAHMITGSALVCVLFLGGWHLPWLPWAQPGATEWYAVITKMLILGGKVAGCLFVMMWLRWTLPRFRFDQVMRAAWKGFIPMTLVLMLSSVGLLYVGLHRTVWATVGEVALLIVTGVVVSVTGKEITGRQANMPPLHRGRRIEQEPGAARGSAAAREFTEVLT